METDVNKKLVLKGASALVAGMFCFGALAPAPVFAQDKPAGEAGIQKKKAPKKAAKKVAKPSKQVMAMQEALNKSGAKLTVDGVMGRKTRVALRGFQKANGLKVSGRLDKATKAKLGI
jgi:peptidoglycan hydrolase-like protein with peptidoglycan-binding domain